jgi:hypothetical protein
MRFFRPVAFLSIAIPALASHSPAFGQSVLGTDSGRYVYGQVSAQDGNTYMLDTETGRLWYLVAGPAGEIQLTPIPYRLLDNRHRLVPEDHTVEEDEYRSREQARQAAASNSVNGEVVELLSGNRVVIRVAGSGHLETLTLGDAGKFGALEAGDKVLFSRFEQEIIDIVVTDSDQ